MDLTGVRNQFEISTEDLHEVFRTVACNFKSTTAGRPVGGEGGHDEMTSGFEGLPHRFHVSSSIRVAHDEMEDRAVVPKVVCIGREGHSGNVSFHPHHCAGSWAEARLRVLEGGFGNVEHGQVPDVMFEEGIDEGGITTSDIDELTRRPHTTTSDQIQ